MLRNMKEPRARNPAKARWQRWLGLVMVLIGVALSWAIVAEFMLGIQRRYWIWVPLGLAGVVLYWIPAWGAIGAHLEEVEDRRARWLRGAGCMALALVVFLLVSALLAILWWG